MPEETAIAAAPAASVAGEGAVATPSVESPTTVEEPIGTTETAEPEAGHTPETETVEPGTESDAEPTSEDGRLLPKSIRALKETDPTAYKAEKARFFEHREYKQTFPTVAEAKRVKQTLELVGGETGLQQMQTDISDFQRVAKQFMDGDPAFVDDLMAEDPIAFSTHIPHMLDKLREVDEPAFNREVAKRVSAEHQAANLRPAIENIYSQIKAGKTDEALRALEAMAAWHDRIDNVAKQEDDPRYKKLKEQLATERKTQAERDQTEFMDSYRDLANTAIRNSAIKLYKSYFNGKEPEQDDLTSLGRTADELVKHGKEFETFRQQRDMLLQRRDKDAAVRHATAAYDQALKMAMTRLMRGFGRGPAAPAKPANGKPATPAKVTAPQGFVLVNARPSPNQIDTSPGATTHHMIQVEKRAILRDGRKVSWKHLTN